MKYLFIIAAVASLFSCGANENRSDDASLPRARAGEGEIILVMDSAKWHGEVGAAVKETFAAQIPGLPQPEPYFSLKYVQPAGFQGILRQAANVIIVMTLDNNTPSGRRLKSYFNESSLERIQNNPELFMHTEKNLFARGQNVLYLFGATDEQAISSIKQNDDKLRAYFAEIERKRIADKIYGAKEETAITNRLVREHQFSLRIPAGYELAREEENFVWIRMLGEVDKSIVVYYEPYQSEEIFEDENLLRLREKMASRYLVDVENDSIYMTTQTIVPPEIERVTFNGKYAVEIRGLWKLSDNTLGGPFLSYVFVDEELGRLYYIEGFVASPGNDKRQPIRELEAILRTFKTADNLKQSS